MMCVVVGKTEVRAINEMNGTQKYKQIDVLTLTDDRQVVNADILGDPYWSNYQATIDKIPVVEIDDLLIPHNKLVFLCNRDNRDITTPENFETWRQYYISTGEL